MFDGFDCTPARRRCPPDIANYCRLHSHDGVCDDQCNTVECGFDGGDCARKPSDVLPGDISIVVLTTPEHFAMNVGLFLLTLSQKLRASDLSVRFEREIRVKRSAFNVGVLVWIEVDVTDCYGDCFSDIDIVANYLGAASAKKVSTCLQRF
ncbi:unnamed protein product [Heligmosomoides polygyrus]|uniref:LNR domain-containing protein n=1 Tax=Heligmosomoides polygyrus TaxID=6339 RepID=A0A3P7U9F1_HELPZ|nr:unnamed protein product [Heligmosomoides polygyrus]